MPAEKENNKPTPENLESFFNEEPSKIDQQVQELQDELEAERDARLEERFVFIVTIIVLLNVVFFSVMPNFGGPLALLIFELIILIPLARRMGIQEMAEILSSVVGRMATSIGKRDD